MYKILVSRRYGKLVFSRCLKLMNINTILAYTLVGKSSRCHIKHAPNGINIGTIYSFLINHLLLFWFARRISTLNLTAVEFKSVRNICRGKINWKKSQVPQPQHISMIAKLFENISTTTRCFFVGGFESNYTRVSGLSNIN